MNLSCEQTWQLAIVWVKSNRVLINCIASPYIPHIGCNCQDLQSQALLAAFQTLSSLCQNNKQLTLMDRYFRVVFRSHCIQMTMGIGVVDVLNLDQIQSSQDNQKLIHQELDKEVVEAALSSLTDRQRQVANWILNQPTPVSSGTIGEHFGITTRGVRKLINKAIFRIENEHHRVRKTVATVS